MGMPGKHESDPAALRIVKGIRVVSEEHVRRALRREQAIPVGFAEHEIVDTSEHEARAAELEPYRVIAQSADADASKLLDHASWVRREVLVIAHAEPCAERSATQSGEAVEERIEVVLGAADHVAADGHQIGLESHQIPEHRLQNLRP